METLFFLPWNRHSLCRGIRVLFPVESLFTLAWNIQSASPMTWTPAVICLKRFAIPSPIVIPSFYPRRVSSCRHPVNGYQRRALWRGDVIVDNSGVAPSGRNDETLLDDRRAIMSTNLNGDFHCTRGIPVT
ncbi:hypothetical protein [Paraburkholderia phytofirmans]|uniref:hypothetical protein n=1 Tax=Paraburkholderia phytofirmans TaxID=261302 RepID=UPI0038BB7662